MKCPNPATPFAIVAAGIVLSAVSPAAGSAAYETAATSDTAVYRYAVVVCNRMHADEQRRCKRDADAARNAAEGATGEDLHEQDTPGGGLPTHRKLPDVERLPDNLASNADR